MEELTAGTRTTALAATVFITLGVLLAAYGAITGDLKRTLGGTCLTMPAVTLLALTAVRRWTTDTSAERGRLSEAQRAAEAERMRYVAAQAALLVEHQRLQRDTASDRAQITARLESERAAMREAFEEQRAALVCQTMEATVKMLHDGEFSGEPEAHGKVMQFPIQEARPRRESARDHGATRG